MSEKEFQKLREQVAKLMGWTLRREPFRTTRGALTHWFHPRIKRASPKDYARSRDAIAEAVATLEGPERAQYIAELSDIVPKADCFGVLFPLVEAEPWQRALAFVRVKEAQQDPESEVES